MRTLCTQEPISTAINSINNSNLSKPAHGHHTGLNTSAKLARWRKAISRFFVTRYYRHIDRQSFNNVLTLDDRTLKDIGVTRQDVKWASRLPLSEDAAMRLEQIARRR